MYFTKLELHISEKLNGVMFMLHNLHIVGVIDKFEIHGRPKDGVGRMTEESHWTNQSFLRRLQNQMMIIC